MWKQPHPKSLLLRCSTSLTERDLQSKKYPFSFSPLSGGVPVGRGVAKIKKSSAKKFFICQTMWKQPHPKSLSWQRGTFSPSLLGEGGGGWGYLQQIKKEKYILYPKTHSQSTISANSVSSSTHSNIIIHLLKYVFPSFQQTKSSQADKHDS